MWASNKPEKSHLFPNYLFRKTVPSRARSPDCNRIIWAPMGRSRCWEAVSRSPEWDQRVRKTECYEMSRPCPEADKPPGARVFPPLPPWDFGVGIPRTAGESKQHQDTSRRLPRVSPRRPQQGRRPTAKRRSQAFLAGGRAHVVCSDSLLGFVAWPGDVPVSPPLGIVCGWPDQASSFLGHSSGQRVARVGGLPSRNSALSLPRLSGCQQRSPLHEVAEAGV